MKSKILNSEKVIQPNNCYAISTIPIHCIPLPLLFMWSWELRLSFYWSEPLVRPKESLHGFGVSIPCSGVWDIELFMHYGNAWASLTSHFSGFCPLHLKQTDFQAEGFTPRQAVLKVTEWRGDSFLFLQAKPWFQKHCQLLTLLPYDS